jgi:sec-independent protein translocase protein TatA
MFGGLGMWEIVLIFLVVLLLFGAKRLPEIGSSLGKGIREFKGSLREIEGELKLPEEGKGSNGGAGGMKARDADARDPGSTAGETRDGEPRKLFPSE